MRSPLLKELHAVLAPVLPRPPCTRDRSRLQDEKEIELLVLRHQLKVLQRQVKRPQLRRLDRVLLAAASGAMTRSNWSSFQVRPETLLRWHRELVRKKWTHRS